MEESLVYLGTKIAAFMPVSGVAGAATALVTGYSALRDLLSGKIQWRRSDTTPYPNVNERCNVLRKRILACCITQLVLGGLNLALLSWLFVFATIKKDGTTPVPDAMQSGGFLALFSVILIAIATELTRAWLSGKYEKVDK
jgi:hypothetical protein